MVHVSSSNEIEEASHGSNVYQTWKAITANFAMSEEKFQGIYYEVRVECSNPDVTAMEPVVFMSEHNVPKKYVGPKDWVNNFHFRFQQLGKCKRIAKELHQEAVVAQALFQEYFASKPDEYKVSVVQCKR